MGFYSPSQLIQDARRHKLNVLPVCINNSDWSHSLDLNYQPPALRLGLRLVKGVSQESSLRLMKSRNKSLITSIHDLKRRKIFNQKEFMKLVNANAFQEFDSNRRHAYWQSLQMDDGLGTQNTKPAGFIKALTPVENMLLDYRNARGVSLDYHPMQLLRNRHPFKRCVTANHLLTPVSYTHLTLPTTPYV